MINRYFYKEEISKFVVSDPENILGVLAQHNSFNLLPTQRNAWVIEIEILQTVLAKYEGLIMFEYSIPRMGKRIDVLLVIKSVLFILEFKVGESDYKSQDLDQVWDYALDLKNFHETSHDKFIAPILVATEAVGIIQTISLTAQGDKLLNPVTSNAIELEILIDNILQFSDENNIDISEWENGRYCPTPTIVEAAIALYRKHKVEEISRSDASAKNLSQTSQAVADVIKKSKENSQKSICFVTGVPGAGKTLVGLNIANSHMDKKSELYSVFLSGNGPLVAVLREALARDRVKLAKENNEKLRKGEALSDVKAFIQNVHNFRDEYLRDQRAPIEHVVLFDEAQRAWDLQQTINFMVRKKNYPNFKVSEPEYLISCMDRHPDWAVVVCLVGGGQEINTGEAGIGEWVEAINRSFPDWNLYISSRLTDSEFGAGQVLKTLEEREKVHYQDDLHLAVSMRSFRAEHVSLLVKQLLDIDVAGAKSNYNLVKKKYPIVITRDLNKAKTWLRNKARGTERYGLIVSSQAERLKPHAIDVHSPMNPIHWFLEGKEDVRSSYFLESVATEFSIQGLELDWACVNWDADFRFSKGGWQHWSFRGKRWIKIRKEERQQYLKNAYRVLLTRARQGVVIVVPPGCPDDPTRKCDYYNETFEYLKEVGFDIL